MRFVPLLTLALVVGSPLACRAETFCFADAEATCAQHTSSTHTFKPWADAAADKKVAREACTFTSNGITYADLTRTKTLASGNDAGRRYRVVQVLCLRGARPAR